MVQQFYDVVAPAIKNRTKEQPIFREYFTTNAIRRIQDGEPLTDLGELYLTTRAVEEEVPTRAEDEEVPDTQPEEDADTQMEPAESQSAVADTQSS